MTTNWQTYRNEEFGFEFKIKDEYKNIVSIHEEKPAEEEILNKIVLEDPNKDLIAEIYIYPLSWLADKVSKEKDEEGKIIWEQDIPLIKKEK